MTMGLSLLIYYCASYVQTPTDLTDIVKVRLVRFPLKNQNYDRGELCKTVLHLVIKPLIFAWIPKLLGTGELI